MTKFAGKNMRRTALMLLCSVSLVLPALAKSSGTNMAVAQGQQGGGGGRARMTPEQRLDMMQKELSLSPEQTAKVKAIMDEAAAAPAEERRAAMMAQNEKIKAVLNDDQKAKFDAMQARMRAGSGGGGGGPQ